MKKLVFLVLIIASGTLHAQQTIQSYNQIEAKDSFTLRNKTISEISTDTAMGNSDKKISTQRAVKINLDKKYESLSKVGPNLIVFKTANRTDTLEFVGGVGSVGTVNSVNGIYPINGNVTIPLDGGGTGGTSLNGTGFVKANGTTISYDNTSYISDSSALHQQLVNQLAAIQANASAITLKQDKLNGTGFVKANGSTISYDNTSYTPTSRTIKINGVTKDLSSNQDWGTIGGGSGSSGTDSSSYHSATTLSDSSGFTLNRPNGTKDTIQIAIPAPIDTANKFVNNIYKLPNDAKIYFKIGNTTYSIKDSVGNANGGSGGIDTSAIHKTGDETITSGNKFFNSAVTVTGAGSGFFAPYRITPSFSSSASSDTLVGLYINPTFAASSIKKYGLYSTSDLYVNGIRIGIGNNTTDQTNTVFGKDALNAVTSGSSASFTAIGYQSFKASTNASFQNTGVGYNTGQLVTTGTANTAIGANAMSNSATSSASNVAVGTNALAQTTGSNNIAIGSGAGRSAASGGVYIGNGAGQNETGSNKLYIANNNTSGTIYGDLSTGQVVINARTTPSQGTLASAAQFQVNSNALITNRGSIPAPRMVQAQRDLIAVQQGVLTEILMTSGGAACTTGVTVTINGGGGSGAAATATFNGGTEYISITSGGTGYDPATTTVTFSGGGCSTAPTGVPIIGAQGLSIYCIDCTANDGTRGVLQYYNGSSTSPWKNAW